MTSRVLPRCLFQVETGHELIYEPTHVHLVVQPRSLLTNAFLKNWDFFCRYRGETH